MQVRAALPDDADAMWTILRRTIAAGDTLPFDDGFDRAAFSAHWFTTQPASVAVVDGRVGAMYKFGANFLGRGAHVASATYVVDPALQGRGIGRALVAHSIDAARGAGFTAMQFNYVVSTNLAAVALYRKLGFAVVGTLPRAFRHAALGLVDVYVMFRTL
ncbi:MAG TPA: N-acetyltransferase [Tahibacter sp.]|uniref:GNAT family N-acetyltransferase n=1 Tax=Tahibacter sp. TaxID=2056211 RepID=UPI002CB3504D|nr:N-acetyltransferase [Tahibacter sp.]HSX61011.1 N-acetyltransferase [Tahibacter sp.]